MSAHSSVFAYQACSSPRYCLSEPRSPAAMSLDFLECLSLGSWMLSLSLFGHLMRKLLPLVTTFAFWTLATMLRLSENCATCDFSGMGQTPTKVYLRKEIAA